MITGRTHDDFDLFEGPVTAEVVLEGRPVVSFAGCSYLGLTGHPVAEEAASEALRTYGIAASVSRAYGVANPVLLDLEHIAAEFFGVEDAFCTGAGYLSSPLAISALADPGYRLFLDQVCHHSIVFGAQASGQPLERFPHGLAWTDPEALTAFIKDRLEPGEKPLLAMDGITGLMGDLVALPALVEIAEALDGILYVDDAHAVGVLGTHGRGSAEHFGVRSDRLCFGATFSKALGGLGGVLFGSHDFIDRVRRAPMARGSNLGAIPSAAGVAGLMKMLMADQSRIQKVQANIADLKARLTGLGLDLSTQPTPIASFAIGDLDTHKAVQRTLYQDHGLFVCQSTYTGADKNGVLRIGIFADHTTEHFDRLIEALRAHL